MSTLLFSPYFIEIDGMTIGEVGKTSDGWVAIAYSFNEQEEEESVWKSKTDAAHWVKNIYNTAKGESLEEGK